MQYTINALKQVITDSMALPNEPYIYRKNHTDWLYKSLDNSLIKAVTGFRRVGKSMLLKKLVEHLVENQNADPDNIFYINFEHDALIGVKTAEDLRSLYELFVAHSPLTGTKYLFLDEIQNIKGWERFVRTMHESQKDICRIYITGSNSSILSGELATSLGGRVLERKIKPFNFREYLSYKGKEIKDFNDLIANRVELGQHFNYFLSHGGMPESISLEETMAKSYLDAVFQKVVIQDVAKRASVRRVQTLQDLFKYAVTNVGSITSVRSLQKVLSGSGENITSPTISKYLDLYHKSYALKEVSKFNWKLNRIFEKNRKLYVVDNSFISAFSLNKLSLESQLLENFVFNVLDECEDDNIFYGQDENGKKIDFVVKQGAEFYKYQVSVTLNQTSSAREFGNFALIANYCGKENNFLVTLDGDLKTHDIGGIKIHQLPALYFALGEDFYRPYL